MCVTRVAGPGVYSSAVKMRWVASCFTHHAKLLKIPIESIAASTCAEYKTAPEQAAAERALNGWLPCTYSNPFGGGDPAIRLWCSASRYAAAAARLRRRPAYLKGIGTAPVAGDLPLLDLNRH